MTLFRLFIICILLSFGKLYAQDSLRTVIAKQGDGIYSILRNNGLDPTKYYHKFIEINKENLKGGTNLLKGKGYLIPVASIATVKVKKEDPKDVGSQDIRVNEVKLKEEEPIRVNPIEEKIKEVEEIEAKNKAIEQNEVEPTIVEEKEEKAEAVEQNEVNPVQESKVDAKELKSVKTVENSLFGDEYKKVEIKSDKLKGAVYYLISGHGGPDPGAIGRYDGAKIAEDEYAYDITLRLARELISHEALVYIIVLDHNDGIRDDKVLKMDKDEVNYPDKTIPVSQVARLNQRVEIVNELYIKHKGKYQRLIVTHIDSRTKGQNIDVFFYHHGESKNGKRFAKSIHETFKKKYEEYQPNRKYNGTFSGRKLYLVNNTLPAMAYIEIGNIQNKKDQKRILEPENRQALAKWISEGALLDMEKENK